MPRLRHARPFLLAVCAALVAACGGDRAAEPGGADAPGDRPVIGVSLLTTSNPFFVALGEQIRATADSAGYDVVITGADQDIGRQQSQMADFVVQGVAAIIVTPADSRAIGTSIRAANEAGIPVFTADIASVADDADVVAHIATDNAQAGRMAATAMVEALGGSGKVGILDHPEVESVLLRTRGFQDAIRETAPGITVVAVLPGGGARDRSFRAAQDMLQAHPDLAGIFAINDPSALGAVAAIEEAGRTGRVRVVGVDGLAEGREAIRAGSVYADAVQHPDLIGRRTVEAVVAYLAGEPVEPVTLIPTSLYRQADARADTSLGE